METSETKRKIFLGKEKWKGFRLNHGGACPMGSAEIDCPYISLERINCCLEDCYSCDKLPEQFRKEYSEK
jgi:hypothetical protein